MSDYIVEKSNKNHPGVTILKNGDKTALPIGMFVDNLNGIVALLHGESDFHTLVSTGMTNPDQYNEFIKTSKKFLDQCDSGLLLSLKNIGDKVYVPDFTFFSNEYDKIMKSTDPNTSLRMGRAKTLYESFSSVLSVCIDKNNENGLKRGFVVTNSKNK